MGCMENDVFLPECCGPGRAGAHIGELPGAAASCAHPRCFGKLMVNSGRMFNLPFPCVVCTCKMLVVSGLLYGDQHAPSERRV